MSSILLDEQLPSIVEDGQEEVPDGSHDEGDCPPVQHPDSYATWPSTWRVQLQRDEAEEGGWEGR